MDKPGSWFLLEKMFEKHLWKRDILSKYTAHRPASLVPLTSGMLK